MINRVGAKTSQRRWWRDFTLALAVLSLVASGGAPRAVYQRILGNPFVGSSYHGTQPVRQPQPQPWQLAALTRVGFQTATGTSLTVPTHAVGDIIYFWSVRASSGTAPALPSGYNTLLTVAQGANVSARLSYRIATATNDASGTHTNATELVCVVYRPSSGYTALPGQSNTSRSTTTTVNYPALSPMADSATGLSWVSGFFGAKNITQSMAAPSGMTNVTSITGTVAEAAVADTNAGVSSWSSTNVTAGTGNSVSCTIETVLAPKAAGVWSTNVYQHIAGGGNPFPQGQTITSPFKFTLPLDKKSGAGNTIVVDITYDGGATVPTCVGAVNGSFGSAAVTALGGTGNLDSAEFVLPGITAGQETITITFAAAITAFKYRITEYYGVALTFTATAGSTVQSTALNATIGTGSFTPPNNDSTGGNLIHAYFNQADQAPGGWMTRSYPGANFTKLSGDTAYSGSQASGAGYSIAAFNEAYVQATHTAINPSFVSGGENTADNYNSLCVVLKISAGSGTPPPAGAIQLNSIHHFGTVNFPTTSSNYVLEIPSSGNERCLSCVDPNLTALTVSDSEGNIWTKDTAGAVYGYWHCDNTAPNPNLIVYITGSSADNALSWRYRDIANAAASPYLSAVGSGDGVNGLSTYTPSALPNPSAVPAMVIWESGLGQGPGFSLAAAPTGAVWELAGYSGEQDTDLIENADIGAYAVVSATGSETWTANITNVATNSTSSTFIVFQQAPAANTIDEDPEWFQFVQAA